MLYWKESPFQDPGSSTVSKALAGSKVIRQSCVDYSDHRGTVCPNWTRTDLWGSCRVTGHSTRTHYQEVISGQLLGVSPV